jgi:hypothetical protein
MKRLTRNELLCRAARSDVQHWVAVNHRCPTCLVILADLPTGTSLYPHMVGECETLQTFVGPGWIRNGRDVDAPLADGEANRHVSKRDRWSNVTLLSLAAFCLTLAALILWSMFR